MSDIEWYTIESTIYDLVSAAYEKGYLMCENADQPGVNKAHDKMEKTIDRLHKLFEQANEDQDSTY